MSSFHAPMHIIAAIVLLPFAIPTAAAAASASALTSSDSLACWTTSSSSRCPGRRRLPSTSTSRRVVAPPTSDGAGSRTPSHSRSRSRIVDSRMSLYSYSGNDDTIDDFDWNLRIAIIGAGPSGLLLAHRLAKSNLPLDVVDVYEFRSDPRRVNDDDRTGSSSSSGSGGGVGGGGPRAYALGIGVRGRTSIRSVDESLWRSVKRYGRECERFRLHVNSKFDIKLRDVEDGIEPSLLIYQTDLCASLLNELDVRSGLSYSNDVRVHFDSRVSDVDLASSMITLTMENDATNVARCAGPYDLIVGCDGSNSIVRDAMMSYSPLGTFAYVKRKLYPGCFKVARADKMPPLLDPNSVALILPEKSSGITAFVEPTVDGGACILFAGRLSDDAGNDGTETIARSATAVDVVADLGTVLFPHSDVIAEGIVASSSSDIDRIVKVVIEQFPLLEGTIGIDNVVRQLLSQRTSVADSVKCNTYNSNRDVTPTALCGDAAHATGGVSGQGANSALVDSASLADCLIRCYVPPVLDSYPVGDSRGAKRALLHGSISSYSHMMVPEGLALYDLSFGNDGKTVPIFKNIRSMISNVIDGVFGGRFGIGKKPLQTLLASSSKSFVEIRRDRNDMYVEDFPSDEALQLGLDRVYSSVDTTVDV